MEVPSKLAAVFNQHLYEVIVGNVLVVNACVANRHSVQQVIFLHQLHSIYNPLVHTPAAARVCRLLGTLYTHCEGYVSNTLNVLAEGIVNQRSVGKNMELAVVELLRQLDDVVLANQRLSACHDVHVGAHLVTLLDDAGHLIIA